LSKLIGMVVKLGFCEYDATLSFYYGK
jgi:hypothetical protein